ncbi:MAG: hypothetical protein OXG25_10620 [Gammaproteobacteria bacterium]|nr:hypothetical protein [Gammaproteobacteria bacterium]
MSRSSIKYLRRSLHSVGFLSCFLVLVSCIGGTGGSWLPTTDDPDPPDEAATSDRTTGHLNFESPHSRPIAVHPDGDRVYVVNTPSDTVDAIGTETYEILDRIRVGVEPVGIGIKPDGTEVWVSNHVSDSVSVIDSDASNITYHQVLHTIQVFDEDTKSTRFDEPVSIAFVDDEKAYIALSSTNEIAAVDVASWEVTARLQITAQDPRAMVVRNNRLYVIPFESNNQTGVSGCLPENMATDPNCTFDADAHVVNAPDGNAQSLSLNYVLDIVRDSRFPDRDLYIFDTETDELLEIVDTLGTLLYGITVDSEGNVFVAQAEARNDANGKSGTEKHGLRELENRAFLNQVTKVDCTGDRCDTPEFIDLEPLPPEHPERDEALATPFAIQISDDDTTIVATAAASDKVFTMSTESGEVLDQLVVDSIPRGLALISNDAGEPERAWVLNALANSVSVVDVSDPEDLEVLDTIQLEDPSDPILKQGRIAFNSASASSTGTFACASCHPDGHTDQLLWVLDTPLCDVGCDQIQPRLVQDIRGLRGTAPYHWDGIPGDPFGGINTSSIETYVEPNCEIDNEESCTLHLIDGSLETTMCDQNDCALNDEDKPGHLNKDDRDAMSKYLLSVPYPPSVERPYDNTVTELGLEGIRDFHFNEQCGNCHYLPHWTTTNMGGSGMDLPSWRGASDRWKNAPQNRFFFVDQVGGDTRGFPERFSFTQSQKMYQMILEGSVGAPGSFARQVTLNSATADADITEDLLGALELADQEGAIVLEGEGILLSSEGEPSIIDLSFEGDSYQDTLDNLTEYSRDELLDLALDDELLITLTARFGPGVDYEHPQPTIWPAGFPIRLIFPGDRPQEFPELYDETEMRMRGDYISEGASLYVDGRKVDGTIRCESGELPDCEDNIVLINLEELPSTGGLEIDGINVVANNATMHLLQVQNPQGLFSNDFPFFVLTESGTARYRNILGMDGTIDQQGGWRANTSSGFVTWNGEAHFTIYQAIERQPWRVSLEHDVTVRKGLLYSICYTAKSDEYRYIEVNVDTGPGGEQPYRGLMSTGIDPEVGGGLRNVGVSLNTEYRQFHHRFIADESDNDARLTFNLAQSVNEVWIDNVGVFFGKDCGEP